MDEFTHARAISHPCKGAVTALFLDRRRRFGVLLEFVNGIPRLRPPRIVLRERHDHGGRRSRLHFGWDFGHLLQRFLYILN